MSTDVPTAADEAVYPDGDGQPMADNTLQWDWMVKIVGELREVFAGQQVFVAGDLLWYPVKGDPKTRMVPDALVAFGRPPGTAGRTSSGRRAASPRRWCSRCARRTTLATRWTRS